MRLKCNGTIVTIPDKLIYNCNDPELKKAIAIFLQKCDRIVSKKRQIAANAANEAKIKQTKKKIQNAINLLRLEGKPLTIKNISSYSNVAQQTIKKYFKEHQPSLFD